MSQNCAVCISKDRLMVDRQIVSGVNLARVAREFGLEYNAVFNHAKTHVSRQLSQALEKRQTEEQYNLLDRIDTIVKRCESIFLRNEGTKDLIALKALSEQRSTFELVSKIAYTVHQSKLAEIELEKLKSGEVSIDQQQDFKDSLSVLTIEELKLFHRLSEKLASQDKTIQVLPMTTDTGQNQPFYGYDANNPVSLHTGNNEQPETGRMRRTVRRVQDRPEQMQVRPITGRIIPG